VISAEICGIKKEEEGRGEGGKSFGGQVMLGWKIECCGELAGPTLPPASSSQRSLKEAQEIAALLCVECSV
jgi:hypothetical protein